MLHHRQDFLDLCLFKVELLETNICKSEQIKPNLSAWNIY